MTALLLAPFVLMTAGVIAFLVFIILLLRSMWQVAPPNEALVISGLGGGREGRTFKIVTGGGSFVFPGLQKASRLSLNLREADLRVQCVTGQGIPVVIQGVCIYKISDDPASITNAARRFIGQNESSMDGNIQNLFDGHLRSIIGGLTVEQLIRDRVALTDATREAAKTEVENLGLKIDSLQIKDIGDPTEYIANLAKPHIATVQQLARVAQAAADQTATVAEQEANAAKAEAASLSAIKQAEYAANTNEARAKAEQQGPLASAIAQQGVIVEQTKMTQLAAERTEQELQVTVRKPADAEAYRIQRLAEGSRAAAIATADGEGQAINLRGLAEAAIVKAKLLSEADGIKARSEALATNQEAVIAQKVAELLPNIVAEAAKPFANIKDLIVLNGGEGLNNMLTGTVATVMTLLPKVRAALSGFSKPQGPEPENPVRRIS